jgi:hypothetical protein
MPWTFYRERRVLKLRHRESAPVLWAVSNIGYPAKVVEIVNAHQKYATKSHHHFDWRYRRAGEFVYPDSGLMLAQVGDGRWIIQQEFGNEFSRFPGVLKSGDDLETEPQFYPTVQDAAKAAFRLMVEVYPGGYEQADLDEFLSDD